MKLIATLAQVDGGLPDSLCVAGDGHQRIYRGKVPLSLAGINVRGRSRQLKVNYRTSEQIRLFAQSILDGIGIDDLDEGQTTIVGDRSVFTGPKPEVVQCADDKEEAKRIVTWAKDLIEQDKFADYEICVTPYKPAIRTALEAEGIQTFELKQREEDPGPEEPGVPTPYTLFIECNKANF